MILKAEDFSTKINTLINELNNQQIEDVRKTFEDVLI